MTLFKTAGTARFTTTGTARRAFSAALLATASAFAMTAAHAQDSALQLEEIIVTATKTGATALQSTPLAITAFSSDQLSTRGIADVSDLAGYTPGLQVTDNTGYAQLYIRGIGSNNIFLGSDPSTTMHVDGVYIARPLSYFSEFLDVERVEVLRGPQGTLYGRNSVGGTVNIVSRAPSEEVTAEVQGYVGNYDAYGIKGYLSGALPGTDVRVSFAFNHMAHDAYFENVSTGNDVRDQDSYGFRTQLLVPLGDRADVTLRLDYSKDKDARGGYTKLLGPIGVPLDDSILGDYSKVSLNSNNLSIVENYGGALEINYELADGLTLKSLTGIRAVEASLDVDADGSSLGFFRTLFAPIIQRQYSEELNLTAKFDDLTVVGGAYYFQENNREPLALGIPAFGVSHFQKPRLKSESYAFYLQGEYQITERLSAIAGIRYTDEAKDYYLDDFWTVSATLDPVVDEAAPRIGAPAFSDPFIADTSRIDDAWTPKFGLNFQATENALIYGSITRGFKSGGYDLGAAGLANALKGYGSEFLWAYEIGIKSDWFDDRLRVNVSSFYYDYNDLQVTLFTPPANAVTDNAADATVKGVEFELLARPVGGLDLFGNVAYLDAYYSNYAGATVTAFGPFDASGQRLNNAPEWSLTVGATYTVQIDNNLGSAYVGADYHWQSASYFTPANDGVNGVTGYLEQQPSYGLWNARVGWDSPTGQWGLTAIGRNLTNKGYITGSANFTVAPAGRLGDPRTVMFQLNYKY